MSYHPEREANERLFATAVFACHSLVIEDDLDIFIIPWGAFE